MSADDKKRTILLPIDGSAHCQRAFTWYLENMKKATDLVLFVHIVEPAYSSAGFGIAMDIPRIDLSKVLEESLDEGKVLGKRFLEQAKSANIEAKAFLHVDSKPGRAILESSKNHNVTTIIIGNRGLGSVGRTIMGSVSDFIVHNSHIPVIVVPPLDAKQKDSSASAQWKDPNKNLTQN